MDHQSFSRRKFLRLAGLGAGAMAIGFPGCSGAKKSSSPDIQGFEEEQNTRDIHKGWEPVSDRKIRIGLVGYGVCKFSAQFGFQNHPNVVVEAVSDLFSDRCKELARVTGCSKTYPSLEELVKDDKIEAVFVATDAPHHA